MTPSKLQEKMNRSLAAALFTALLFTGTLASAQAPAAVPSMVNYNGTVTDLNHKPLAGATGVTFALYKDEQGGSPLWTETQNVQPDKSGATTKWP